MKKVFLICVASVALFFASCKEKDTKDNKDKKESNQEKEWAEEYCDAYEDRDAEEMIDFLEKLKKEVKDMDRDEQKEFYKNFKRAILDTECGEDASELILNDFFGSSSNLEDAIDWGLDKLEKFIEEPEGAVAPEDEGYPGYPGGYPDQNGASIDMPAPTPEAGDYDYDYNQ